MRRLLLLLCLVFAAAATHPAKAASQCHQDCVTLYTSTGQVAGHGCVWNMDMFTTCIATAVRCFTNDCHNALVTDANGAVLAEADICHDKVTLKPARRAGDGLPGTGVAQRADPPQARTRTAAGDSE